MSEDQQQLTKVRTLEQYGKSKAHVAALQAEMRNISDSMVRVASHLRALSTLNIPNATPFVGATTEDVKGLPAKTEDIVAMANDFKEEMDRKFALKVALNNMGLPVAD